VSVLEGIRNKLKNSVNVVYNEGCKISENEYYKENIILQDTNEARKGIKEAYQAARDADVIILAIGANQMTAKEGGDRTDLKFVGLQDELIDAMVSTGKPVIALLFNGQPLNMTDLSEKVPVIFECWYLGQEAGNAVADILFGDVNPSGKLSVSIPRNVGQVPVYYYQKNFTESRKYIFTEGTPLYPFGYGLSYTSFRYSNIRLKENKIRHNGSTSLLIDVSNTGNRMGTEIVQLYVRDLVSSVTRPAKELKGFQRVSLDPGNTMTVEFPIKPEHLAFYDREMDFVVEPGDFKIMAGGSSRDEDLLETLLTVIK
jgi:beta-glucosidase